MKLVSSLLVLALATHLCVAMPKGFGRKKETVPMLRDDMKYIQCEMCERVAKQAYRTVKQAREELPQWESLTEATILEKLESLCDPEKENAGEWIAMLDVQQENNSLRIAVMTTVFPPYK